MVDINQELLHSLFKYQHGQLIWKVDRGTHKVKGKIAGYYSGGYIATGINGKGYLNHRLIYLMHHGTLPEIIDHIDGNPLNNTIENLRAVTRSQNACNQKLSKNNKSGVKGVWFSEKANRWCAEIRFEGKSYYVGRYLTLEEAAIAANDKRTELHKEYTNTG